MRKLLCAWAILVTSLPGLAQDLAKSKASVSMEPAGVTSIDRGRPSTVQLQFRVARGFHVNSNRPKQEYLKKTELKLDAPTDIVIGRII